LLCFRGNIVSIYCIVDSTHMYVNSTNGTHCCVSMATLSIFTAFLVNNLLDVLFQCIYFTSLRVSRNPVRTNCISTSSGMYHLVWYADRHTGQSPTRVHERMCLKVFILFCSAADERASDSTVSCVSATSVLWPFHCTGPNTTEACLPCYTYFIALTEKPELWSTKHEIRVLRMSHANPCCRRT
jgi:hypothetical protein